MAGALKQDFIEAVRLTPDGIQAFLETPLPTAPQTGAADETATEALSAYLLTLFNAFAGLTPVELLLRIGQHNNVLEAAMLAGLEYISESDSSENDVTIVEPQGSTTYTPGEMRFFVTIQNGTAQSVTMELDGETKKMVNAGDGWQQYVTVSAGAHTLNVTAQFDDTTQSDGITFTVVEEGQPPDPGQPEPEPPGGTDNKAITRARQNVLSAYKELIKAADQLSFGNAIELLTYYTAFKNAVQSFLSTCQRSSDTIQAELIQLSGHMITLDSNAIKTISSKIINTINEIYTEET